MTFTAVVTGHGNDMGLRVMLGNIRYQTRPPDETIALVSGLPLDDLREDFQDVRFVRCEDMHDWGHSKRAHGIELATEDWVGFFNDDDSYRDDYLEKMLAQTDDNDVVFCEWNENPACTFALYRSTAGNFIVRTEIARRVGWTSRVYEADGHFIEAVKASGARIAKVQDLLYFHNVQGGAA